MAARKSGAKRAKTPSGSQPKKSGGGKSARTASGGGTSKRPKKQLTPAEEERRADQRRRNLDKAREARLAKLKIERDKKIWTIIGAMKKRRGCRCKFRKGWTWEQLRPLNAGCTDSENSGLDQAGWVCPTLDAYRRYLEDPEKLKDA
jgi:hypothetical protein